MTFFFLHLCCNWCSRVSFSTWNISAGVRVPGSLVGNNILSLSCCSWATNSSIPPSGVFYLSLQEWTFVVQAHTHSHTLVVWAVSRHPEEAPFCCVCSKTWSLERRFLTFYLPARSELICSLPSPGRFLAWYPHLCFPGGGLFHGSALQTRLEGTHY